MFFSLLAVVFQTSVMERKAALCVYLNVHIYSYLHGDSYSFYFPVSLSFKLFFSIQSYYFLPFLLRSKKKIHHHYQASLNAVYMLFFITCY